MNDVIETILVPPGKEIWEARTEAKDASRVKNREVVMATLKALGITHVFIKFNGSGDDGQIQSIKHKGLLEDTDLHDVKVEAALRHVRLQYREQIVEVTEQVPQSAYHLIEEFAYDITYAPGVDWVNNGGGYGEIQIDVGNDKISMTMNERIETVNTTEHDL